MLRTTLADIDHHLESNDAQLARLRDAILTEEARIPYLYGDHREAAQDRVARMKRMRDALDQENARLERARATYTMGRMDFDLGIDPPLGVTLPRDDDLLSVGPPPSLDLKTTGASVRGAKTTGASAAQPEGGVPSPLMPTAPREDARRARLTSELQAPSGLTPRD